MEDWPNIDTTMDTLTISRILESGSKDNVNPMFCQMNQLADLGYEHVWMEVARWIKFQEVLDEDAHRWSKPHVPCLSLKALVCLSKELRQAPLLLDPEVTDFYSVIDKMVAAWVQYGFLERHMEEQVKAILRKPIRHVHEHKLPRSVSMGTNLLLMKERGFSTSSASLRSTESAGSFKEGSTNNSAEETSEAGSRRGTPKINRKNAKFQRKVPKNAVATNILVGEIATLRRPLMALVRLNPTRHLGWLCEVRLATQFVFVCLSPGPGCGLDVIEMGRCVGTLMIDPIFREVAGRSCNRFEVLAGIREFTSHLTALPSCVWDPTTRIEPPTKLPPQDFRSSLCQVLRDQKAHVETEQMLVDEELSRTGKLFGGLIDDVRRKVPWYLSDFKDCLHVQCLASAIFLFLATLTPNVTFGGLLGQETDHFMGTMECILAASITGIAYALFSGQPLNILGSTGPMLVLETIIFQFCRDNQWDFMPFRVWIGFWTTFILIVIVAFDLSALVRFITRFTEECFACLIALIFIYEAFAKVIGINDQYPVHLGSHLDLPACSTLDRRNSTQFPAANTTTSFPTISSSIISTPTSNATAPQPTCHSNVADVFFLSFLEFLFTFAIAFGLVRFRSSIFFPNVVRQTLSDFGVLIAILVVVGADMALQIDTPKLTVPDTFSPTRPGRPWMINPVSDNNPWWLTLAALLPALLATILVFMDQQITAVIVNRKEHKLKKGCGYHLDILVLAVLIAVNSVLGLPWFVAATVSAIAHIMSLKVESDCTAPGEKPEFLGVREQRVTALLVGILSGLSVLLTGVLKFIPLPVLYGVFLFMGVTALDGMQLVDRCVLFIISPKYQPDYPYLRHVALYRVHIYTFVQVTCLAALWIIKSFKETSIGFPILVLAICFVRKFLDCIFTQCELSWLDHVLPAMCSQSKKQDSTTNPPNEHQHHTHDKRNHDLTEMTASAINVHLINSSVNVSTDEGIVNLAIIVTDDETEKSRAVVA